MVRWWWLARLLRRYSASRLRNQNHKYFQFSKAFILKSKSKSKSYSSIIHSLAFAGVDTVRPRMIKLRITKISAFSVPSTATNTTAELAGVHIKYTLGACGYWLGSRNLCVCGLGYIFSLERHRNAQFSTLKMRK